MGEFSLWRRENPASNCKRQLCCKQIPLAGSDAPNLAQEKSLQLCTSEVIRRFPKGNGGKRVSSGYNRRRRLAPRSSGKQQAERTAVRTAPIVCPEESPLLFCRNIYTPLGFSPTTARRFPKGERKALWCARRRIPPLPPAGPDATTPSRGAGLAALWALNCIGWRSEGVQGASGKPPACIDRRQLCRKKSPLGVLTRRLRRGLGLAVPWGTHTFLSVAKEKCAKESQRHGDSRGGPPRCASRASSCGSPFGAVLVLGSLRSPAGKKPFIAHF